MTRRAPTSVEEVRLDVGCDTCAAPPRSWCVVGLYGSPSPFPSARWATELHTRRGMLLANAYHRGLREGLAAVDRAAP